MNRRLTSFETGIDLFNYFAIWSEKWLQIVVLRSELIRIYVMIQIDSNLIFVIQNHLWYGDCSATRRRSTTGRQQVQICKQTWNLRRLKSQDISPGILRWRLWRCTLGRGARGRPASAAAGTPARSAPCTSRTWSCVKQGTSFDNNIVRPAWFMG